MDGESYLPIFTKFIPRIIWKDKPTEDMGQIFGHRYFILYKYNYTTSMNFPVIAELFANFGILGIIIGMSLLGLIYSFFDKYFNSKHTSLLNKIISYAFLFSLAVQESNFSMVFGQVILGLLGFYFLNKLLFKAR